MEGERERETTPSTTVFSGASWRRIRHVLTTDAKPTPAACPSSTTLRRRRRREHRHRPRPLRSSGWSTWLANAPWWASRGSGGASCRTRASPVSRARGAPVPRTRPETARHGEKNQETKEADEDDMRSTDDERLNGRRASETNLPSVAQRVHVLVADDESVVNGMRPSSMVVPSSHGRRAIDPQLLGHFVQTYTDVEYTRTNKVINQLQRRTQRRLFPRPTDPNTVLSLLLWTTVSFSDHKPHAILLTATKHCQLAMNSVESRNGLFDSACVKVVWGQKKTVSMISRAHCNGIRFEAIMNFISVIPFRFVFNDWVKFTTLIICFPLHWITGESNKVPVRASSWIFLVRETIKSINAESLSS